MSGAVSDLVPIMAQVVERMDELIYLSESQFEALKQGSIEVVAYVTGQQEKVSQDLEALDDQGKQIVKEWAEGTGLAVSQFDELLPRVEETVAADLSQQRDAILARSLRLQEINQFNEALVKQGLKYTQKVMGIVNGSDSLVYNRLGDFHRTGPRTRVDTKF